MLRYFAVMLVHARNLVRGAHSSQFTCSGDTSTCTGDDYLPYYRVEYLLAILWGQLFEMAVLYRDLFRAKTGPSETVSAPPSPGKRTTLLRPCKMIKT
eukprot:2807706-Pleurochrysis_carterae.AAC.2